METKHGRTLELETGVVEYWSDGVMRVLREQNVAATSALLEGAFRPGAERRKLFFSGKSHHHWTALAA